LPEPPPPSIELGRGLAIYLPLDQSLGLADASGLGQVVRMRGADPATSWIAGHYGDAVDLAGGPAGAYLFIESSSSLIAVRTELSVASWVWIKPDSPDGTIISRRWTGTGGYLWSLRLVRDRLNAAINSASGYHVDLTSSTPLPKGQWVHVAFTFSVEDRVRLYIGGAQVGSAIYQMGIPPDNSPILIGASEVERPDNQPPLVMGRLGARVDEVTVYDRALPEGQVSQLASGVRPEVKPTP